MVARSIAPFSAHTHSGHAAVAQVEDLQRRGPAERESHGSGLAVIKGYTGKLEMQQGASDQGEVAQDYGREEQPVGPENIQKRT